MKISSQYIPMEIPKDFMHHKDSFSLVTQWFHKMGWTVSPLQSVKNMTP